MGNIWDIRLINAAMFDMRLPIDSERETVWNVNNLDVFVSEFVCLEKKKNNSLAVATKPASLQG